MSGPAPTRGQTVVLAVAMVYPTAAAWLYFRTFGAVAWTPLVYAAAKLVQFSLPLAWRLHAGSGSWRPTPRSGASWIGLGTGVGIAMALISLWALGVRSGSLAAHAAPRVTARLEAIGAAGPLRYLALAAFLALAHSLLEEYYWRWFVYGRLRDRLRAPAATAASSLAFMAHHVIVLHAFTGLGRHAWTLVALSAGVAGAGALWAWLYERSDGLGPAWLSHALTDVAILTVGYDLVRSRL